MDELKKAALATLVLAAAPASAQTPEAALGDRLALQTERDARALALGALRAGQRSVGGGGLGLLEAERDAAIARGDEAGAAVAARRIEEDIGRIESGLVGEIEALNARIDAAGKAP
jgi:hypothetical protein